MKKLALILAVALLATPAFAVKVSVVPTGPLTADIVYDSEGEDVAAFAIDIDLSAGDINEVSNFHVGVSTAAAPGYGIFPANFDRFITVNGQGDVDNWGVAGYTPLADPNDKGENPGGITIELGALYKGDANKPAATGRLCTIKVTQGCTATPKLNAIRGGVVLTGAGAPASFKGVPGDITGGGEPECLTSEDPGYNDWVAFGKPPCWCFKTHCHGDADGQKQGNAISGFKRVFTEDLAVLVKGWAINEPPKGAGILSVEGAVCADFNHAAQGNAISGFKRVFTDDLARLVESWAINEAPKGVGVPQDCPGAQTEPEP